MVLRLDPRLTTVWRAPHTLQIGTDRPRRVLDLTPGEEHLLSALRIGTTRDGLAVVAERAGLPSSVADALLDRLGDAVLVETPRRRPLAVVVEHSGLDGAASTVAAALLCAGVRLVPRQEAAVGLAVPLAAHVLSPSAGAGWLGRDIPHVPMVFGDAEVEVGPLVLPGRTACLTCVTRHRLDEDPEWAAVATQLLHGRHRAAAADAPLLVHQAVVVLLRALTEIVEGRRCSLEGRSVRIGGAGVLSERRWTPVRECSCQALPSGAAPEPVEVPVRERPRTAAMRIGRD